MLQYIFHALSAMIRIKFPEEYEYQFPDLLCYAKAVTQYYAQRIVCLRPYRHMSKLIPGFYKALRQYAVGKLTIQKLLEMSVGGSIAERIRFKTGASQIIHIGTA